MTRSTRTAQPGHCASRCAVRRPPSRAGAAPARSVTAVRPPWWSGQRPDATSRFPARRTRRPPDARGRSPRMRPPRVRPAPRRCPSRAPPRSLLYRPRVNTHITTLPPRRSYTETRSSPRWQDPLTGRARHPADAEAAQVVAEPVERGLDEVVLDQLVGLGLGRVDQRLGDA